MDNQGVNAAILERLEKVVQSLQDNSVKMGQLLAVHNERKVDDRLRTMEKKMWSIFGALTVISFIVSIPGQTIIKGIFTEKQKPLTNLPQTTMIYSSQVS